MFVRHTETEDNSIIKPKPLASGTFHPKGSVVANTEMHVTTRHVTVYRTESIFTYSVKHSSRSLMGYAKTLLLVPLTQIVKILKILKQPY